MNPKNSINPAALAALLPAALFDLATATGPYALAVDGNALAPRIRHGEIVKIKPAVNVQPQTIAPGSVVLAVTASNLQEPYRFDRPALFTLSDALMLTSGPNGGGESIAPGAYIVLGIAQEGGSVNVAH